MAIKNNQIENNPKPLGVVASAPVTGPGVGAFYVKTASGIAEGFYVDSLSQETQITENGVLLSSGETNSGVNIAGAGAAVFKQKTGLNLEFRKLVGGANCTITESASEIVIASSGGGGGEANTASSVGSGQSIFKQKTGVNLEFKTLVAGTNITLIPSANEILISASGGGGGISAGANVGTSGVGVFKQNNAGTLEFKKILAGSNISVTATVNDEVSISAVGDINAGANLSTSGAGKAEVFSTKTSNTLNFKRLVAGSNVTLSQDANTITIASSGGGGGSGHETQYLSFDSGNIRILATGTTSDLAAVTAVKNFVTAGESALILTLAPSVTLKSVAATFTSAETTGRSSVRVDMAEPSGSTSLSTSIRPIIFRLNASHGVAATGGTILNTAGVLSMAQSGYTAAQEQRIVLLF